jgi:hypothetical protein
VPTAAACHGGWTGGDGEQSRGQDRTGWRRRAEHPMSDGVVDVELLTHGFRLDNAPASALLERPCSQYPPHVNTMQCTSIFFFLY